MVSRLCESLATVSVDDHEHIPLPQTLQSPSPLSGRRRTSPSVLNPSPSCPYEAGYESDAHASLCPIAPRKWRKESLFRPSTVTHNDSKDRTHLWEASAEREKPLAPAFCKTSSLIYQNSDEDHEGEQMCPVYARPRVAHSAGTSPVGPARFRTTSLTLSQPLMSTPAPMTDSGLELAPRGLLAARHLSTGDSGNSLQCDLTLDCTGSGLDPQPEEPFSYQVMKDSVHMRSNGRMSAEFRRGGEGQLRQQVLRRRSIDGEGAIAAGGGGSFATEQALQNFQCPDSPFGTATTPSEGGSECLNWEDVETCCESMDNASLKVEEIDMQVVESEDGESNFVYRIKFEGLDTWFHPTEEERERYLS